MSAFLIGRVVRSLLVVESALVCGVTLLYASGEISLARWALVGSFRRATLFVALEGSRHMRSSITIVHTLNAELG